MILSQPDIYRCKASDRAAVARGVAAGVAMAIVKKQDKRQGGGQH